MSDRVETVVTARAEGFTRNAVATTPAESTPNIIVKALSPARIILTRVARVYVQSLVGMLAVVMSGVADGSLVAAPDFAGKLWQAAGLALAPAVMTLLQNTAEILAKLDETKPELRA